MPPTLSAPDPRTLAGVQRHMRMLATIELAERSTEAADVIDRWLQSAPLAPEVAPNDEVRFGCVLAADGRRRRYALDAGAAAYLEPLVELCDELAIEPTTVALLRRLVADAGVPRLGSWIDDDDENQTTGGWSLPSGVSLDAALGLVPASGAREVVSAWAAREGATFVRRLEHAVSHDPSHGALATLFVPLPGGFATALEAARRAFDALGAPWPDDAVAATLAVFPPAALELTLTFTPDGVERIGLVAPAPRRELVLAACDLLVPDGAASDRRLAHYEVVAGATAPEAVELAIGRDGFEVQVHLAVA